LKLRVEEAKGDVYTGTSSEFPGSTELAQAAPEGCIWRITTAQGKKTYAILGGLGDETESGAW